MNDRTVYAVSYHTLAVTHSYTVTPSHTQPTLSHTHTLQHPFSVLDDGRHSIYFWLINSQLTLHMHVLQHRMHCDNFSTSHVHIQCNVLCYRRGFQRTHNWTRFRSSQTSMERWGVCCLFDKIAEITYSHYVHTRCRCTCRISMNDWRVSPPSCLNSSERHWSAKTLGERPCEDA